MPTGTYIWPISGRINSYFGYRTIFGGRSYHSGWTSTAITARPSWPPTAAR